MSQMTDYLEGQIRAHIFRTASFTKPSALGIGLVRATLGFSNANRSTAVTTGQTICPTTPNGRLYRCTTAGTTGSGEPTWPTTSGGTVTDGTAVWTEMTPDFEAGNANVTEVTGGAYARVSRAPLDANWSAASSIDGLTDNVAALTFPTASAAWGVITHVIIADATSAGNMLLWGALTTPKTVSSGDTFSFAIGDLDITFA